MVTRVTWISNRLIFSIPDLEINLLADQVVNLHIVFIKDLVYFRAQLFGCATTWMCCYSNVKVARQNPALSVEFKRLFESKYVAAKVDKVTTSNV